MKTPTPRIFAALSLALALTAHAENWPQWRGPAFNGTSTEKGLPETWTKESAKWATPLPGPSGATPAVWGDAVFVTSPDKEKNLLSTREPVKIKTAQTMISDKPEGLCPS